MANNTKSRFLSIKHPKFSLQRRSCTDLKETKQLFFKITDTFKEQKSNSGSTNSLSSKEYNKVRSITDISKELLLDKKLVLRQSWILNKTLTHKRTDTMQRKTATDYLFEKGG